MIQDLNMKDDYTTRSLCEYVEALEEERRKIEVFQRELPLCLHLVSRAIEAYKREISAEEEYTLSKSECSEQTTSERGGLVFKGFIPVMKNLSSNDQEESHKSKNHKDNIDKTKPDWLRSVQLWNQDVSHKEDHPVKTKSEKSIPKTITQDKAIDCVAVSSGSTADSRGEKQVSEKQQQLNHDTEKKERRCWSTDLHRLFVDTLQQLGGAHVATPKQIKELMKVDGLTNDEIKSHLQKYRLHTRRSSSTGPTPQFVLVGGMWVQPSNCTAGSDEGSGKGEATGIHTAMTSALQTSAFITQRSENRKYEESRAKEKSTEGGLIHCNTQAKSSSLRSRAYPVL